MNARTQMIATGLSTFLVFVGMAPAWGQPPATPNAAHNPQPATKKPARRPAATKPAAERPTAGAKKRAAAAVPQPSQDESRGDSGVAAILATRPTTPVDCTRAATILADLGRPDLAKRFLRKALDAKLSPKQLADLGEAVGSAALLHLAEQDALRPEGRQLADAVSAAVAARRDSPQRIATLIQQLQDASLDRRDLAAVQLQETPRAAIGPLIDVLADPTRAAEDANVRATLAGMGRMGRQALVGVLEGADAKLAVQVILTLGEMKGSTVELALLAPCWSRRGDAEVRQTAAAILKQSYGMVPDRREAVRWLANAATEAFDHPRAWRARSEATVDLWWWDRGQRQCLVRRSGADDARLAWAARWAHDAYLLSADHAVETLYLTTLLEAAQYRRGVEQPLDEKDPAVTEAKRCGVKSLEAVLACAMPSENVPGGHVGAALAAVRLLGQIGSARQLLYQGTEPSLLVQAVRSPNRRVRMAALKAIVGLCPVRAYPGSSDVPRALAFFAASGGVRRALTAAPNLQQARNLAGMLASQGFQADVAATGRELAERAAASPDYELAMIDVSIGRPPIGILLQQLRRDERTASLRVGLMARSGYMSQAEHAAESDPWSMAFAWPNDDSAIQWQLKQLARLGPREFVDFSARQRQAVEALDLLVGLSRSGGDLYDLRQAQDAVLTALYAPKLSARAVEVLANINSVESQPALVEVASNLTLPIELRQAAAKAFRQNTEKHGILLTSKQILQQYRRYNQSEKLDTATQHVLGLILDCIEAPNRIKSPTR